jgi:hypothetical protein
MPLLSKASADRFIEIMVENNPILKLISFEKLNDPVCSYPLLQLSRYKTRSVARNTVATLVNVSDVTISFNAKELVLPLVIPDSYIEDMKSSHEKVANYAARVFGLDLAYLFMNGDTTAEGATDKILLQKSLDGVVKQLTDAAVTVDYAAGSTPLDKIKAIFEELDDNTLADPELKIFIGSSAYTTLWDIIANDSDKKALFLRDGKIVYRGNKEVVEIPELSKIIVMNPGLIAGGMCRDINLEVQRYPEARGNKVVLSCRVDLDVVSGYAKIEGKETE